VAFLDCGGKRSATPLSGGRQTPASSQAFRAGESGVALRFPPHSITSRLGTAMNRTRPQFYLISAINQTAGQIYFAKTGGLARPQKILA